MALLTAPDSEVALLSSKTTMQTAIALQDRGIVGWRMPQNVYGVFDAFQCVSDMYTAEWMLLSVTKRRERNILRRLVADCLDTTGFKGNVNWLGTYEERDVETKYISQIKAMRASLQEARDIQSFGKLTVVDAGFMDLNGAFGLEGSVANDNDITYQWNWCVTLQSFRKGILKNLSEIGYIHGIGTRCMLCNHYVSSSLECVARWADMQRGGYVVVCQNCASGTLWPVTLDGKLRKGDN